MYGFIVKDPFQIWGQLKVGEVCYLHVTTGQRLTRRVSSSDHPRQLTAYSTSPSDKMSKTIQLGSPAQSAAVLKSHKIVVIDCKQLCSAHLMIMANVRSLRGLVWTMQNNCSDL